MRSEAAGIGNWNGAGTGYLSGLKNRMPRFEERMDFHYEMKVRALIGAMFGAVYYFFFFYRY